MATKKTASTVLTDTLNSMDGFAGTVKILSHTLEQVNPKLTSATGILTKSVDEAAKSMGKFSKELNYLISSMLAAQAKLAHPIQQAALRSVSQTNITGRSVSQTNITGGTSQITRANQGASAGSSDSTELGGMHPIHSINTLKEGLIRLLRPMSLLAGAITVVVASLHKMWNELSGFDYGTRIDEIFSTIGSSISGWTRGEFIGFGKAAKIKMETTREFGGTGQVPGAITSQIGRFASVGVSSEAQTRLAGEMYRIAGYGAAGTKAATNILQSAYAIARKNKVGADDLMKSMAQHTDLLANAANRIPGALERAVLQADRMAVSLETTGGFANKITSDFETYLEMQAKLQTIMPGVDLTNVMLASQYGGEADVQTALKGTFGGMDIGTMPRSLRQMISSTTGISEAELVKLGTGNRAGGVLAATSEEKKRANELVTWDKLKTMFWAGIFAVIAALGALAASLAFRGRGPSWGSVIGRNGGGAAVGGAAGFSRVGLGFTSAQSFGTYSPLNNLVGTSGNPVIPPSPGKTPGGMGDTLQGMNNSSFAKNILAGAAALLVMASALWVTAKAVQQFKDVKWSELGMAAAALVGLTAIVGALGFIMSSGVGTVAILAGAAAMVIMAGGLGLLGVSIGVVGGGLKILGESFSMMGVGLKEIGQHLVVLGLLPAGLIALSAAALLAVPTLWILGNRLNRIAKSAKDIRTSITNIPIPVGGDTTEESTSGTAARSSTTTDRNAPKDTMATLSDNIARLADLAINGKPMVVPKGAYTPVPSAVRTTPFANTSFNFGSVDATISNGDTANIQSIQGDTVIAIHELIIQMKENMRERHDTRPLQVVLPNGQVIGQTIMDSWGRTPAAPPRAGAR